MSPIPVNPDFYTVLVTIPTDAGAIGPTFVNTWYFRNDSALLPPADVADNLKLVLDAFYSGIYSGARVCEHMSNRIAHANVDYRVYDLGEAAPRTPHVRDATWSAPAATQAMPNEVSVVLSYHSDDASGGGGTLDRRKRGRLYIGPLNVNTIETSGASTAPDAQVISTFRTLLLDAAENVWNTTEDVTWMQYSRVNNVFTGVTQAYVDNSFDTQRRRGADPTLRTIREF